MVSTSADKSVESYKHKFAKQVLADWLRDAAESVGYDKCIESLGLAWKVNRPGPTWGVYEEYPITHEIWFPGGHVEAWDETRWARVPTYQELAAEHQAVMTILDVAIQHKGNLLYGFEVVHKNSVSEEKARKLNDLPITVYEIDAEWILRQVKAPEKLQASRRFGNLYGWGLQ